MLLKYIREAIDLRKQAQELEKAEKRLASSELDYLMLEKLIRGTSKEIVIKLANGTTLTIKEERNETGYQSFSDRYNNLHK